MTSVWEKLKMLAANPYDLTAAGALEAGNRLDNYVIRSQLLHLFFATERIDDEVLSCLQKLADELQLVKQFRQMRSGKIINRIEGLESENRQVLHTACRDLFSKAPVEPVATDLARPNEAQYRYHEQEQIMFVCLDPVLCQYSVR